jgi:hypothetical protein
VGQHQEWRLLSSESEQQVTRKARESKQDASFVFKQSKGDNE